MPLSGLNRIAVRPRGGVSKVELIPASLWTGSVPVQDSAAWAFREDCARYSETYAGGPSLAPLVRHTLEVEFPATEGGRRVVDELTACKTGGLLAVITMASGEKLVAGYSIRFGTGYPLRVVALDYSSGRTPADLPAIKVTLESIDADLSSTLA